MKMLARGRGFTLVEVLVATALLSLVMLGLLTAMRSFAQSETRIDQRIRIEDDLRVSERFLRSTVSTVSPRLRRTPAGAPRQIDFAGGASALRWIGVMPARHGAGGLYRFHLYARRATAEAPAALVLEFAPYVPGSEALPDPIAVQSRAMANGIGEVRFRYRDDLAEGDQWLAEWPHADRLPHRIGLTMRADGLAWPEVIMAVIPAVGPAAAGLGGASSGPTVGPL
jgi:general secretion pathway protein J